MACPPLYTEPPKKIVNQCPQPVYVTGGSLEVCGLSLEGATLNVEMQDVENLLTELTATLEACCDETNGNLTSIKETITTETSKIVEAIKACCAATGQQAIIDTLKELLGALEACCQTLSGLLEQLVTELKEVNSELDKQTTELKEINSELDKQTTLLTTLISEVSKVTAAIEECCEAVTGLLSQILTELKEVNSELDKQTTELKEVNSELDKQTSELTSIDNKLDKLTSIETLLGQILAALNKPDYDIEHTEICVGKTDTELGETWIRVDRYKDGASDVQGLTWYDASGAPVAAPAGGYTVGRCCCESAPINCCAGAAIDFVDCDGNPIASFAGNVGDSLEFLDCTGAVVATFSCTAPCGDPLEIRNCAGVVLATLGG